MHCLHSYFTRERVEEPICVYSDGHVMTRFQPMRLQHFWRWGSNSYRMSTGTLPNVESTCVSDKQVSYYVRYLHLRLYESVCHSWSTIDAYRVPM